MPVDTDCDWDDEAIERAITEAEQLEQDDRDTANLLRAQAASAQKRLYGSNSSVYDPMRLYARLLREYRGGIRDADFATMHYERFFGYVQELDIMLHEERSEQQKGDNTLCDFPKPEEYTGETIKLI